MNRKGWIPYRFFVVGDLWAYHDYDFHKGFLPQSGLILCQAYSLWVSWAFVARGVAPGWVVQGFQPWVHGRAMMQ